METEGGRNNTAVDNYGWGKKATVEDWLFAEGYEFDFFQAVRLLEIIHTPQGDPIEHHQRPLPLGQSADPTKDIVHFRSAVKLSFPASDIAKIERTKDIDLRERPKAPAEMTVNFLGLAGCLGALDIPSTELVMRRTSNGDNALRDFLDIFNHRLVSLLYSIRKHHRVGLVSTTPGAAGDHIARYLYSLIGIGTPRLQARMHIKDRALLYYAGILARQPRSVVGLKQILFDYFQVEVEIDQFVGKWCDLEENQWTRIGDSGSNQRLGRDTVVLGTRVWDQHASIEIQLGPLGLDDFKSFLPTEWGFNVLCDLVRFYLRDEFDFSIRLILKAAEIPPVSLDMEPALSWMSWLGPSRTVKAGSNGHGPAPPEEDPSIVITPEVLRSEGVSIKGQFLYRLLHGKQSELLPMTERTVPKNTVLRLQGAPGVEMYVIRSGKLQLSRCEHHGKETVVGILNEGDAFGERAVLKDKCYSETALALTDCEVSVLKREDLFAAKRKHEGLQRTIDAYLLCGESDAT